MGESLPLMLCTLLSLFILVLWFAIEKGNKLKMFYFLVGGLSSLALAWFWTIPMIHSTKTLWLVFLPISFILVLLPLATPKLWRRYGK